MCRQFILQSRTGTQDQILQILIFLTPQGRWCHLDPASGLLIKAHGRMIEYYPIILIFDHKVVCGVILRAHVPAQQLSHRALTRRWQRIAAGRHGAVIATN